MNQDLFQQGVLRFSSCHLGGVGLGQLKRGSDFHHLSQRKIGEDFQPDEYTTGNRQLAPVSPGKTYYRCLVGEEQNITITYIVPFILTVERIPSSINQTEIKPGLKITGESSTVDKSTAHLNSSSYHHRAIWNGV